MKRALISVLVLALPLAACDRKKPEGALPPATDWQAPAPGGGAAPMGPAIGGGGAGGGDPHAGVPGAPALGAGGAVDPHAGVPGAPPLNGNEANSPHGGGGVDVAAMGLAAPDPDRPVDPSKVLEGVIDVPDALRSKIVAGAAIFISVRTVDPASGEGAGPPIAVDKLIATGTWPMPWKLTEAQAMIGGTGFTGNVVVQVRFDQDSDAMSKQPGDITGKLKTTIPASGLKVVLDTTL